MTVAGMALESILVTFAKASLAASVAVLCAALIRVGFEYWHGRPVPLWPDGEDAEVERWKGRTPRGLSQCVTAGADKPHRVRRFNGAVESVGKRSRT